MKRKWKETKMMMTMMKESRPMHPPIVSKVRLHGKGHWAEPVELGSAVLWILLLSCSGGFK